MMRSALFETLASTERSQAIPPIASELNQQKTSKCLEPQSTARTKLGTFGLMLVLGIVGCAAEVSSSEVVAESVGALYRDGATFPGRSILVCWENAVTHTQTRADWPTLGPRVRAAATRSWTQATGLRFDGWDQCPANRHGIISIGFTDSGPTSTNRDGYDANEDTYIQLNVSQSDFDTAVMHEFGHALGFDHELNRTNFDITGCVDDGVPAYGWGDAENTPPDRQSIMVSTGYCQNNVMLSAWDVVGSQTAYGRPNYFADVTGDGRADALVINPDAIYVRVSTGTSFSATGSAVNWSTGAFYGQKGTHFSDVTGDGKADAIAVNDYGVVVRPSNGSSFPSSGQAGWTDVAFYGDRGTFFADTTGDGRADAIAVNANGISIRTSNGSSFPASSQRLWTGTFLGTLGNYFVDVNGDGRADAVAVNTTGITVRLSTGTAFGASTTWSSIPYFGEFGTFFADVTGDRRADAIVVNYGGITVRPSNGTSFLPNQGWSSTYWGVRGTMFADADGGGRADALAIQESGVRVAASTGTSFSAASYWTQTGYYSVR